MNRQTPRTGRRCKAVAAARLYAAFWGAAPLCGMVSSCSLAAWEGAAQRFAAKPGDRRGPHPKHVAAIEQPRRGNLNLPRERETRRDHEIPPSRFPVLPLSCRIDDLFFVGLWFCFRAGI